MRQLTKTRDKAYFNENTNVNNIYVFFKKSHRKYKNSKIKLNVYFNNIISLFAIRLN